MDLVVPVNILYHYQPFKLTNNLNINTIVSVQKKAAVTAKQEKYSVYSMQVTFVTRMIAFCSDLAKVLPESKLAQKQQTLDMLVLQNNRISMVLSLIQVRVHKPFLPFGSFHVQEKYQSLFNAKTLGSIEAKFGFKIWAENGGETELTIFLLSIMGAVYSMLNVGEIDHT